MRTEKEIKTQFKKYVKHILSDDFICASGENIRVFQRACALWWVLGGEDKLPIQVYPEVKVLNTEKLYQVF